MQADRQKISIHVINGPNLNLLGQREPDIYGSTTLADIETAMRAAAPAGVALSFFQSNHEGELVDAVQRAIGRADALIINAGALTHSSIALHDALKAFRGKKIELHISNVFARESFRHHSYLSPAVDAVMCGFGADGYVLALHGALQLIGRV